MRRNERYVFFRDTKGGGPIGAQGVTLTSGRSLAIDATVMPYGVPVWVDTLRPGARGAAATPYRRLMVAQDTGGDIKGPGRGDIYLGSGNAIGDIAGRFNSGGRMFLLLPK
jgi:membrane-bound lytic murein transglycosylase A